MRYRIALAVSSCFLFATLSGCDNLNFLKAKVGNTAKAGVSAPASPAAVVRGPVVARVNNMPITLEDLNQDVEAYNSIVSTEKPEAKISTRDQKINYLRNEMIRRALLSQEAMARGLDRKEEVLRVLEKTKQDLLIMELVRQEADKIEVSSKEIEEYYNTYKEQLKEPEERQVCEIVVSSEQEAKGILIRLLQGEDFATLAKEMSKTPSAKEGGDLGFIQKGKQPPSFEAVAFSDTLEVGKISNIFKGPDGYSILKLEAKRGGKQKSLSELWDDIKRGLVFLKQQQRIEELIGKLSRDAKLEVYEGEVK